MTWDDRVETSFETWHQRRGDDYERVERVDAWMLSRDAKVVIEKRGEREPAVSVDVPSSMRGTHALDALCAAAWRRFDEEHAAVAPRG